MMNNATDTSPPRPRWSAHAIWLVVVLTAVGALGLASRWPAGGRWHLPDGGLFASQPVALQIHVLALSLAVPLGVVMMASRKGRAFHRVAGWTWAGLVLIGTAMLLWLAIADGGWRPLHGLLIWVLPLLAAGLWYARQHRRIAHRTCMIWLFYGSILFPGALTFLPGRLMWRLFLG